MDKFVHLAKQFCFVVFFIPLVTWADKIDPFHPNYRVRLGIPRGEEPNSDHLLDALAQTKDPAVRDRLLVAWRGIQAGRESEMVDNPEKMPLLKPLDPLRPEDYLLLKSLAKDLEMDDDVKDATERKDTESLNQRIDKLLEERGYFFALPLSYEDSPFKSAGRNDRIHPNINPFALEPLAAMAKMAEYGPTQWLRDRAAFSLRRSLETMEEEVKPFLEKKVPIHQLSDAQCAEAAYLYLLSKQQKEKADTDNPAFKTAPKTAEQLRYLTRLASLRFLLDGTKSERVRRQAGEELRNLFGPLKSLTEYAKAAEKEMQKLGHNYQPRPLDIEDPLRWAKHFFERQKRRNPPLPPERIPEAIPEKTLFERVTNRNHLPEKFPAEKFFESAEFKEGRVTFDEYIRIVERLNYQSKYMGDNFVSQTLDEVVKHISFNTDQALRLEDAIERPKAANEAMTVLIHHAIDANQNAERLLESAEGSLRKRTWESAYRDNAYEDLEASIKNFRKAHDLPAGIVGKAGKAARLCFKRIGERLVPSTGEAHTGQ